MPESKVNLTAGVEPDTYEHFRRAAYETHTSMRDLAGIVLTRHAERAQKQPVRRRKLCEP